MELRILVRSEDVVDEDLEPGAAEDLVADHVRPVLLAVDDDERYGQPHQDPVDPVHAVVLRKSHSSRCFLTIKRSMPKPFMISPRAPSCSYSRTRIAPHPLQENSTTFSWLRYFIIS